MFVNLAGVEVEAKLCHWNWNHLWMEIFKIRIKIIA